MPRTAHPEQAPPPWPQPTVVVIEEPARARAAVERIATREARALGLAFDLRTPNGARLRSGDDPRGALLESVALALPDPERNEPGSSRVLVLPRTLLESLPLAELLAPLWAHQPAPYLVFADAHRALTLLAARDLTPPSRYGCITIAATLLAEGRDRRRDDRPLERVARTQLGLALPISLTSAKPEVLACEADALLALLRAQAPELRARRLASVYTFECALLPCVLDMERAGFGINAARFEQIASSWVRERASFGAQDKQDPQQQDPQQQDPQQQDLARIARLDKLISTYRYWARDFVDPSDGRIHARLNPLATDSGRFSCTEPNLQQVPSEYTAPGLRASFVPAAGTRLVVADYAQIELRVAAHLAACDALRAVFHEGRDPHRATAATLTSKPEAQIDDLERKLAKAINFGFLFGMGARRFRKYAFTAYGLELSEAEAAAAREAFFHTYPGICAWHRRTSALSRRSEHEAITVTTTMGRRRTFDPGKFSFNAALNIPVQGTAAEGFKLAMTRLEPALRALGGRGVLIVHDEYIAELPAAVAEQGRACVEEVMVAAMQELVPSVPIRVEAKLADHWS